MADTITGSEAADLLGLGSADDARRQLARWGVRPLHREAGQGGQNVYDAAEVREAINNAPGRGHRTA